MAWQDWTSSACPSCGHHDDEWRDENGEELDPPYDVVDRRCLVCVAIEEKKSEMNGHEGFDPTGIRFHLKLHDPVDDV